MARVIFDGVTKAYAGNTQAAVQDLNMEIYDREFLVLVGPSGCGKSTAMRMVAGLEEITGGRIIIGDRVVNDLPPKDRDVAMVFQSYALYPHMTVRDNLAYPLKLRKVPKAERETRVREAARTLDIEQFLDRGLGVPGVGLRHPVEDNARHRNVPPGHFRLQRPLPAPEAPVTWHATVLCSVRVDKTPKR